MKVFAGNPYLALYKTKIQDMIAQRFEFFSILLSLPFAILAITLVWVSLEGAGYHSFGNFTIRELIIYAVISNLIRLIVTLGQTSTNTESDITKGDFINYLCRPVTHWKYRISQELARSTILLFTAIPIGIIAITYFRIETVTWTTVAVFLPLIILAGIVSFFEYYIIGLLSFWIERTWGIRVAVDIFEIILSGALIPLSLFPDSVSSILLVLPFAHMVYAPASLLMGKLTIMDGINSIAILFIWAIIFFLGSQWLWKQGLRKYDGKM